MILQKKINNKIFMWSKIFPNWIWLGHGSMLMSEMQVIYYIIDACQITEIVTN